jgi:hypothetical protein
MGSLEEQLVTLYQELRAEALDVLAHNPGSRWAPVLQAQVDRLDQKVLRSLEERGDGGEGS